MKHRILLPTMAGLAALAFAGAAGAQDWTGSYISLHLGGTSIDDDESERTLFDTNLDGNFGDTVRVGNATTGPDAFASSATQPAGFCGGPAGGNAFNLGCGRDEEIKADFGLRAGWDGQFGGFVIGGLLEVAGIDARDRATAFSTTPANYTFERGVKDVMYAGRVRVGLPIDRALVYATGGLAFAEIEESYRSSNVANSFTPITNDVDASGFQLGGGAEFWVSSGMTLGVEYLYNDLEVDDSTVVRIGPGTAPATNPFRLVNAAGTDTRRASDEFKFHTVRVVWSARF